MSDPEVVAERIDGSPNADPTEVPVADPRPDRLHPVDSLVLVATGDGKGKSTAAFGTMLRAVARGWPVAVVQFVKSGNWHTGEEKVARDLGVQWWSMGDGFTWDSDDLDHDRAMAADAWSKAEGLINGGEFRLVILDEVTYPINWGWIDVDDVVATLAGRPRKVSVFLTGRNAPEAVIDVADTVTEMREVKHAYQRGIAAKKGIDY